MTTGPTSPMPEEYADLLRSTPAPTSLSNDMIFHPYQQHVVTGDGQHYPHNTQNMSPVRSLSYASSAAQTGAGFDDMFFNTSFPPSSHPNPFEDPNPYNEPLIYGVSPQAYLDGAIDEAVVTEDQIPSSSYQGLLTPVSASSSARPIQNQETYHGHNPTYLAPPPYHYTHHSPTLSSAYGGTSYGSSSSSFGSPHSQGSLNLSPNGVDYRYPPF